MIRRALGVLLVAALVTIGAPRVAADPGGSQLVSWSALCTGVTEGIFTWKTTQPTQCTSLPNRITQWTDVTGAINTVGCATGNPLPTWSQVIACKSGGAASTLTSSSFTVHGQTYTAKFFSTSGTYACNGPFGATSATLTTPSVTKAPTSSATQLSWTPSSVSGGGGSVTVTLTNPSSVTVLGPSTVANGATAPLVYSAAGAAAGVYTWTVTNLGAQTCDGTNGVQSGTEETAVGSYSWYQ